MAIAFPGVAPAAFPGGQLLYDNVVQTFMDAFYNPAWDGVITFIQGNDLSMLDATQLQQLTDRLFRFDKDGQFWAYSRPVPGVTPQGQPIFTMKLNTVTMTIEIPFADAELMSEILRVDFYQLSARGASRKTPVCSRGDGSPVGFGNAWGIIGSFINHYAKGFNEVAMLTAHMQKTKKSEETEETQKIDAALDAIRDGVGVMDKAATLWNQMNAEFEKEPKSRNQETIKIAFGELWNLFRPMMEFCDPSGERNDNPLFKVRELLTAQPPVAKIRALCALTLSSDAADASIPKTTAEMLDQLLTVPGRAKEIAAAMAGPGSMLTLRLDNKLWNVHQLDMPSLNMRDVPGLNMQQRESLQEDINRAVLNLPVNDADAQTAGLYTTVTRQPVLDRHVFKVMRIQIGQRSDLVDFTIVGKFEVRPVQDGDRTELYNPMRTHGRNSIRGTMMEQRVHEAMEAHRVHHFSQLPQEEQHKLRKEVDRYADERDQTRFEGQELAPEILTREEQMLAPDTSDERLHQISRARAAKVSSELKKRFIGARVARLRTHGDNLRRNPAELMQPRVHALFDPNRHDTTVRRLTSRERQFFGENLEGGYVDTVENAIEEQSRRASFERHASMKEQESASASSSSAAAAAEPAVGLGDAPRLAAPVERVHYGYDPERIHQERVHGYAPYNVASGYGAFAPSEEPESKQDNASASSSPASALAAPAPTYGRVNDALADYEMQEMPSTEMKEKAYKPVPPKE